MSTSKENTKVILFDGICNLCNNAIKFIIKNDKKNIFQFAPLQGEYGIKIQNKYELDSKEIDSIILLIIIPIAPSSLWAQIQTTDLLKRGSAMVGIAIISFPERNGLSILDIVPVKEVIP